MVSVVTPRAWLVYAPIMGRIIIRVVVVGLCVCVQMQLVVVLDAGFNVLFKEFQPFREVFMWWFSKVNPENGGPSGLDPFPILNVRVDLFAIIGY